MKKNHILFFFLIPVLLNSCNKSPIDNLCSYSFIKDYQKKSAYLDYQIDYNVDKEIVNDSTIDFILTNPLEKITEDPIGIRLVFSPHMFIEETEYKKYQGLYFIFGKEEIFYNNVNEVVYAFLKIETSDQYDSQSIVYYSSKFGLICLYSPVWDNILILNKTNESKKDLELIGLKSSLIEKEYFFPIPENYFNKR